MIHMSVRVFSPKHRYEVDPEALKEAISAAKISQKTFARKMGISYTYFKTILGSGSRQCQSVSQNAAEKILATLKHFNIITEDILL